MIKKNPAYAAMNVAMGDPKIVISPFFEPIIIIRTMGVTGGFQPSVKLLCVP
jgi:hypothetical protein